LHEGALGALDVQAEQRRAGSALLPVLIAVPARHELLECAEKGRPESSALGIGPCEDLLLNDVHKEILNGVFSLVGSLPGTANVSVERLPILAAKARNRLARHLSRFARLRNQGP